MDIVLQDLTQLKSIYKERWETVMGNAGPMQFFGNNDLTTLEYLSKRLGKSTIMQVSRGEISNQEAAGGFTGESTQLHTVELMTADEIARFFSRQSNAQILIWPGTDPIAIDRMRYYSDPFLPVSSIPKIPPSKIAYALRRSFDASGGALSPSLPSFRSRTCRLSAATISTAIECSQLPPKEYGRRKP
jgi:type IV secretory pathway TraG/TraD family ATPase VirD4